VVDSRAKLGLGGCAYDRFTVIVVVAGAAKVGECLVVLLDLDRMLGGEVAAPGAGQ
jgi:hypothetical protein